MKKIQAKRMWAEPMHAWSNGCFVVSPQPCPGGKRSKPVAVLDVSDPDALVTQGAKTLLSQYPKNGAIWAAGAAQIFLQSLNLIK